MGIKLNGDIIVLIGANLGEFNLSIKFENDEEYISFPIKMPHVSNPFIGGIINRKYIPDLIDFLKETLNDEQAI